MAAADNNPLEQIRKLVTGLTLWQQLSIILAAAATVALVWGAVKIAGQEHFETLYANLEGEDTAEIVTRLREENVPYKVAPGGRAVEVPASRVDDMRIALSGEGLPRGGGVGFELFDRSSFGMSDFVQNVNYRRALERELARTIERLHSVSRARVHLVVPPETLFVEERREAKASVVVELNRGRNLGGEEIAAISHLVGSAVDGLSADKVSVVDTSGRMLSDGQGDGTVPAMTSQQIGLKAETEKNLTSKLVAILEPVVGPGKVRARADVNLDFTRVQRTEEQFDPAGAVVRSEQSSKQKRKGASSGGAPGSASNLPTGTPVAGGGGGSSEENTGKTVNYEINRTVRNIDEAVGAVTRLSVAVVVDNAPPAANAATPDATAVGPARTAEEMRKLTDLVKATVGYDQSRGDILTVENIAFDRSALQQLDAGPAAAPGGRLWIEVARYGALVAVALMLLMFVVRPAQKTLRSVLSPARPELAGGNTRALAPEEVVEMRRRLLQLSSDHPEGAARVVSAWVSESGKRA